MLLELNLINRKYKAIYEIRKIKKYIAERRQKVRGISHKIKLSVPLNEVRKNKFNLNLM